MSDRKDQSHQLFRVVVLGAVLSAFASVFLASAASQNNETKTTQILEKIKDNPPLLRMFMQKMPKGGDLHNHLGGSVYPETYLEWAAADGLCVDLSIPAILKPGTKCWGKSRMPAKEAMKIKDDGERRRLIDGLSMRSFVPTPGWSGHDQFFATFDRTEEDKKRFGYMLAEVTQRASRQNLLYLELMNTGNFSEIRDFLGSVKAEHKDLKDIVWSEGANWEGPLREKNLQKLYDALRAGFIKTETTNGITKKETVTIDNLVGPYIETIQKAEAVRKSALKCGTNDELPGCKVVVRFLYQNLRSQPADFVFTQFFFSWAVTKGDKVASLKGNVKEPNPVVGMNLVTPEDWRVATRDYRLHMEMLDFLWQRARGKKKLNIALHAGELTLGNVRPDELKYRIGLAIGKGHAKRIGHGVAIAYEDESLDVLQTMADEKILIEINLTSNAKILNVSGRDHPMRLYHAMKVPIALSTDDEGVLRSDLTRDYVLAVVDQGFGYADLKTFSLNSLDYSFLDQGKRLTLRGRLDTRFVDFEAWVKNIADKICVANWWSRPTTVSC